MELKILHSHVLREDCCSGSGAALRSQHLSDAEHPGGWRAFREGSVHKEGCVWDGRQGGLDRAGGACQVGSACAVMWNRAKLTGGEKHGLRNHYF